MLLHINRSGSGLRSAASLVKDTLNITKLLVGEIRLLVVCQVELSLV